MGLITWHRWFRVTPCWLVTLLGSLPVANSDSVPAMAMRRTRPFVQCGLCLRLCTRQLGASLHTPPRLLAGDPPVASGFCSLLACFRSDECGDTITTYIYMCVCSQSGNSDTGAGWPCHGECWLALFPSLSRSVSVVSPAWWPVWVACLQR
jgi:hypothetical protein